MKPITREWISKAEGDWTAAGLLFRARRNTNHDATCFHAQQCAEKYLKARLEEAGVVSGKTHDLVKLLALQEMIKEIDQDTHSSTRAATSGESSQASAPAVFIGQGRSPLWLAVKSFLENDCGLHVVSFESEAF